MRGMRGGWGCPTKRGLRHGDPWSRASGLCAGWRLGNFFVVLMAQQFSYQDYPHEGNDFMWQRTCEDGGAERGMDLTCEALSLHLCSANGRSGWRD
jgi:hypothetical protein